MKVSFVQPGRMSRTFRTPPRVAVKESMICRAVASTTRSARVVFVAMSKTRFRMEPHASSDATIAVPVNVRW